MRTSTAATASLELHRRLIAVVEGDGDLERHATQRWQARAIAWHDG